MIIIETKWPWHCYTGTMQELIDAGHATAEQFPQGRKRYSREVIRVDRHPVMMRGIEKLIRGPHKGLYLLQIRMTGEEEHVHLLHRNGKMDLLGGKLSVFEKRIDRVLQSALGSAQDEGFRPLSEIEKQKLTPAELMQYEIREILGDSLSAWDYDFNAMLTLKKHHCAAQAANE